MQQRVVVPLIIASAMFMQTLDSTILTTALPAMAEAVGEPPLRLHLTITAYLISLAAFLPLGGWLADRLGPSRVFKAAIILFTIGSLLCGFSQDLPTLIAFRFVQGIGGAMMTPVGRMILIRSVSKTEMVGALTLMAMPGLLGPILGPPLGGFITTAASWRWIFWINLPIGLLGLALVSRFIRDVGVESHRPFDRRGIVLSGLGFAATLFGFDVAATHSLPYPVGIGALVVGVASLALYAAHAARIDNPVLDLRALRVATLRISVAGGSLFRVGVGALPFLVPLMLQEGFGYTPLQSGLITIASAIGAFGARAFTTRILKRFGFRTALVGMAAVSALFLASYASFGPTTPATLMFAMLALGGIFRSVGFATLNALGYVDVPPDQLSTATGLSYMAQRLSQAVGVSTAAALLHLYGGPASDLSASAFSWTFLSIAGLSALSLISFARLRPGAGGEFTGSR